MKKILFAGLLFVVTVFMCIGPVCAASVKIGVIDVQRIMRESKAAQNARAVFLKDVEAKRGVLNAKQKEVQDLQEELKNKGKDMAASVREEKTNQLTREVRDLNRLKSDLEEELKKNENELTQTLLKEISEVVQEYCKKEKYTVIHEKRTILASDEAVDITDKIIKLYDVVK
ncbi:OmpH family outer membrane protein [Deltaproteobacteria bacterium]|nr:OmpH family outer membrane protein [Deltaproteobacteria bacterium]